MGCAVNSDEKVAALKADMDECLMKPMSKEEIRKLLLNNHMLRA